MATPRIKSISMCFPGFLAVRHDPRASASGQSFPVVVRGAVPVTLRVQLLPEGWQVGVADVIADWIEILRKACGAPGWLEAIQRSLRGLLIKFVSVGLVGEVGFELQPLDAVASLASLVHLLLRCQSGDFRGSRDVGEFVLVDSFLALARLALVDTRVNVYIRLDC